VTFIHQESHHEIHRGADRPEGFRRDVEKRWRRSSAGSRCP
jgi:hypothetical protein